MITNEQEYLATREYADRVERILLELRKTHTGSQYEGMSKGFLKELARARRDITMYLALPPEGAGGARDPQTGA
jgi:hypothetical protein